MSKNQTALAKVNDDNTVVCTFVAETTAEKKELYNATTNPKYMISEFINKQFVIRDIYMSQDTVIDKDTGVVDDVVKIILIDDNGDGILTMSRGVRNDLYALCNVFGLPHEWDEPMLVEVKQVPCKSGHVLKLYKV